MFKSILKYITKREWGLIGVIGLLNLAQVWLNLEIPIYTERIMLTLRSGLSDDEMLSLIWADGRMMLFLALMALVAVILICLIASVVAASLSQRIRSRMYDRVDSFSMGDINKFSLASLITRSTNDVTQVQMVFSIGLQLIIYAPMLAVWALLRISGGQFVWTVATGVSMGILTLLFVIVLIAVFPKFKKMQTLTDNVNRITREKLAGLPVIRAYNAEKYQETKFEVANEELTSTQLFTTRAMAMMMPLVFLIMNMLVLALYWICAILINETSDWTLFAAAMKYTSYAMQVMLAVMMILMLFIFLPRAQVAARRIYEVIETEPTIIDGNVEEAGNGLKGDIEFRNVSFKYPGAKDYVLKDVSFSAKQGETIAFIGSTGSGKSTLINLVPRFYDVSEGSVLFNGVDVREYKLGSLYEKIGYIPQKSVLFSGTVKSNVAFGKNSNGKDATEEDVRNAVRIAQGQDFVEKMEGGYEAAIARGGQNLSGGQKQRISIARAVCKKPEIYIFDDSFSALDYKTDRALRTALKKETKGVTSMIVAQRIGTIMDADKIVVLEKGTVVGIGKHKELLRNCGVYREIAISQLSEEELAI